MAERIDQVNTGVPRDTKSPYPLEDITKVDADSMPSPIGNLAVNAHFPDVPPWKIDNSDPDNPVIYDLLEVERVFISGDQAYVIVDNIDDWEDN